MLHIANDNLHIYAAPLSEGYCLSLIQRSPSLIALSRRSLMEAAKLIEKELFSD